MFPSLGKEDIRCSLVGENGADIKLDDLKIESNALIKEVGSTKDLMSTEIVKTSSEDRAYKTKMGGKIPNLQFTS